MEIRSQREKESVKRDVRETLVKPGIAWTGLRERMEPEERDKVKSARLLMFLIFPFYLSLWTPIPYNIVLSGII